MWLESKRSYLLTRREPDDCVVRWTVDVKVPAKRPKAHEPGEFSVGRLLADELRIIETEEWGFDVWEVADADSSGLEAACAAVLDEQGNFRQHDFEGNADPLIYLYCFELHPDFTDWRIAVMDSYCRTFSHHAIILAQYETLWVADTEFHDIGFRMLPDTVFPAPPGYRNIDRNLRFMVRDNGYLAPYRVTDYPKEFPSASREHSEWLEAKRDWT